MSDICDRCEAESDRYTQFPICRQCSDVICLDCASPGTLESDEGGFWCMCVDCVYYEEPPEEWDAPDDDPVDVDFG